jgi:ubiquinone/menaquinone biosynthesis C-methylase UbiE
MDRFYEDASSLIVRAYDAFYGGAPAPPIAGDVDFYERFARDGGGPVLELACGTGRIALPLAERGLEITGVDISEGMLAIARRKAAALPEAARQRLTLVRQDMSELDLDHRFNSVFIALRSFQALLTVELQRRTLAAIRRHLLPGGRLALHLFDPRFDLLTDDPARRPAQSGVDAMTGSRYMAEVVRSEFDRVAQVRRDLWLYVEYATDNAVLDHARREMALRWTWRWELRHLLELCGFVVEVEHSDFDGSAPAYGKELIVVARVIR